MRSGPDLDGTFSKMSSKEEEIKEEEIIISLPKDWTIRCGPGTDHKWGGYVRLCDETGREIPGCYWDKEEWRRDPELVMGAIFQSMDYIENGLDFPDEPMSCVGDDN